MALPSVPVVLFEVVISTRHVNTRVCHGKSEFFIEILFFGSKNNYFHLFFCSHSALKCRVNRK